MTTTIDQKESLVVGLPMCSGTNCFIKAFVYCYEFIVMTGFEMAASQ